MPPRIRRTGTLPAESTMCKINRYDELRPSGRVERHTEKDFCARAMPPDVCSLTAELKHPLDSRASHLSPRAIHDPFPPTPPRSSHSASGSDRSSRRRSSVYIDVNGATVMGTSPQRSSSRREKRDHLFAGSPPLSSRSPSARYSSPISPRDDFFASDLRHHRTHSRGHSRDHSPSRLRPTVKVEVSNGRSRKTSRSHGSSASRDSSEETLLRNRRLADMLNRDHETSHWRVESEIARANELIANRPAVPMAPSAPAPVSSSASRYRRPSVKIDRPDPLLAGMNALHIHDREVLSAERELWRREKYAAEMQMARKREDEEAQRQRLKSRMTPRRNTVSDGRHSVAYDHHGPYRYE